jgi:putative iron-only hydrogenase system regulator
MDEYTGIIGIANKNSKDNSEKINSIIWNCRDIVVGRMGIPRHDRDTGIVALVVEGKSQEIKILEDALKSIDGLHVKSLYLTYS